MLMTMKTPSINSSSIWFAPSSSTSTLKSVQSAKTNTNNGNASPRSVSAEIDKQALARNLLAAALPVHPDSDDLSVGRTKIQLGEARAALGDWKRAHHLWNEALDIQHERLGSTHTLVADTLSRRAVARSKMGMFHEAIMDLEKALQIQQSLAEKKTNAKDLRLSILTILSELGSIQQKNNHLVEANRNFEAALLIANDVYGEKSREKIADIHCLIGKLSTNEGGTMKRMIPSGRQLDYIKLPEYQRVINVSNERNITWRGGTELLSHGQFGTARDNCLVEWVYSVN
eukprot:CAMPEP_0202458234 /NCGR_PEP_ID=MMETSP1360-20130828/23251_1 /ASSEMBLY_ACC=CAM_ASM_000848 /TAXON_ID=515479 /ORGANISM="Licmophora paradoxa, Strain CCMP2313" /LENGTH=286 /DNA_ID=CAMNT_0049078685 /DNA_START=43 /DNA_END=904 /DNA_ORIENTATION=+